RWAAGLGGVLLGVLLLARGGDGAGGAGRAGAALVREAVRLREPFGALFGGDQLPGRVAGKLPAGPHPSGPDQRGAQLESAAGVAPLQFLIVFSAPSKRSNPIAAAGVHRFVFKLFSVPPRLRVKSPALYPRLPRQLRGRRQQDLRRERLLHE